MNYKKWVYDDLDNYQYKKMSLVYIPEKIRNLKAKAETIRAARTDGTPVQGGGNTREEMLVSNIAERTLLEKQLRDNRNDIKLIDAALEQLPEPERKALEFCYLYPQTGGMRRLQEELGYEKSQAYVIRDQALKHFALLLHGRAEV